MKNIFCHAKKNYHILFLFVFAVMTGLSLLYIQPQGADMLLAARASDGFFSAVRFGMDELGEGAPGAFLCTLFAVCPALVWKALDFLLIIMTVTLVALLPYGRAADERRDRRAVCSVLVFTGVLFTVMNKAILSEAVFSITGLVHCVIPAALILTFFLIADNADGKGAAPWLLPVIALAISLLSYQAAVAALVICLFVLVKVLRSKEQELARLVPVAVSLALFAATSVIFLLRVAGFPKGMSRLWILRSFFASMLSYGGFFTLITVFMLLAAFRTMCCDIIPAIRNGSGITGHLSLRIALFLFSSVTFAVLILHSPLISAVIIPGVVAVALLCITSALALAVFISDAVSGDDRVSFPFALAAAASLFAALVTYTFGGESYYIPTILAAVFTARLFTDVQGNRAATVTATGLAALYVALNTVTRPHFAGVAYILLAGAIIQASPLLRKHRIFETAAVLFLCILFFMSNRWL